MMFQMLHAKFTISTISHYNHYSRERERERERENLQ